MSTPKSFSLNSSDSKAKRSLADVINDSHDLTIKNPTNALRICATIMRTFQEVEGLNCSSGFIHGQGSMDGSPLLKSSGVKKFSDREQSLIGDLEVCGLIGASVHFLYFILNVTTQEFHRSYAKFIKQFNNNNANFCMDEQQFTTMLHVLCKKEHIGKAKLSKCFSKIAANVCSKNRRIDEVLNSPSKEELGSSLVKELVGLLKDGSVQKGKNSIDYLKLLPITIGFFSEDIKKKIQIREEVFQEVSGINNRGEKIKTTGKSFIALFESLGLDYKEIKSTPLNLNQIQKSVMFFWNSFPSQFSYKQIEIVIKQIQTKYKYDNILQDFRKPPQFNKKFITYLSYLVCMNFSCQKITKTKAPDAQALIVEEYVLWNSLAFAITKLDPSYISNHFLKYARKNSKETSPTANRLGALGAGYIKKILPGAAKKNIDNIMNTFMQEEHHSSTNAIIAFGDSLYSLIIKEAENKLFEYITSIYEKFDPNFKASILEQPSISQYANQRPESEKDNTSLKSQSYLDEKSRKISEVDEDSGANEENYISSNQYIRPLRSELNRSMKRNEVPTIKEREVTKNALEKIEQDYRQSLTSTTRNETSALKQKSLTINQSEKSEQDLPQSLTSIKSDRNRLSLHGSFGTYSDRQEESKILSRNSLLEEKEKLMQDFRQTEQSEKNLKSCYIMGTFLEKCSQSRTPKNESRSHLASPIKTTRETKEGYSQLKTPEKESKPTKYKSKSSAKKNQPRQSQSVEPIIGADKSFVSDKEDKEKKVKFNVSRRQKGREDRQEALDLKSSENAEKEVSLTYKEFNHEKLTFSRRIKEGKKKRAGVCGIRCCVM